MCCCNITEHWAAGLGVAGLMTKDCADVPVVAGLHVAGLMTKDLTVRMFLWSLDYMSLLRLLCSSIEKSTGILNSVDIL